MPWPPPPLMVTPHFSTQLMRCCVFYLYIYSIFVDWDDVEGSPGQVDDISSCSEEAADLQNGDVTDDIIKEDGADE